MEQMTVIKHLGFPGVMISASKSGYLERHPKNLVVFNANVCIGTNKVWWGDVDITLSKDKLISLSKELMDIVYVLSEMGGRFENEDEPKIENYIAMFLPNGDYKLNEKIQNHYDIERIERMG